MYDAARTLLEVNRAKPHAPALPSPAHFSAPSSRTGLPSYNQATVHGLTNLIPAPPMPPRMESTPRRYLSLAPRPQVPIAPAPVALTALPPLPAVGSISQFRIPLAQPRLRPHRRFQCAWHECTQGFDIFSHFRQHYNGVHPKIRPHPCRYRTCKARFTCPSALELHVNTVHLKQKKHHCRTCGKGFGQTSHRNRHAKLFRH